MPDLDDVLGDALADGTGPGIAVAVVGPGGEVRLGAAGVADPATGRPMTPDTPACVASVSKTLTAAAILRLRDAGRLALEDPLVRHLPEVAGFRDPFGAASAVTLRDVLRHLAGLPGEPPSPTPRAWDPAPLEAVLADPASVTWAIRPGSAFKYSNLGYELLGEVIARAAGTTYDASVREAFLGPLGMSATTLDPDPGTAATGSGPALDGEPRRPADPPPPGAAAGGWWSTARDLAAWARFQLDPPDRDRAAVREAHAPVVVADPGLGAAYGLGWRQYRRGDHVHVGHGGLTNGFEARVELDPERGIAVGVLVNGIGPRDPATRLAARLFALAGDEGAPSTPDPRPAPPAAPADPRGIAGSYREVGFETLVTVELTPGGPWLRADGDPGSPLLPTPDPDRFRVERGRPAGEDLVVLRRPDGTVDAITIAGYVHARRPS